MKHLLRICDELRNRDDRGATSVEYGLMVAGIAIAIIAGVTLFGLGVNQLLTVPTGVFNK